MTRESREKRSMVRAIRSSINDDFNNKAMQFINAIEELEGGEISSIESLCSAEILRLYGKIMDGLNRKLMMSRNNPLHVEYLNKLRYINNLGVLPKSTKIILDSF